MKAVRFLVLTLLCASLALVAAPARADGSWEYIGTHDGVKVHRKEVPGSGVFAFKGETVVNQHIGKIISVFLDRGQRKHWVDRYDDSITLDKPDAMHETYWIKFKLPFPVTDRDYVLQAEGFPDATKGVFTARIKSVPHAKKPPQDCCVRAQAYGTYYRFEAVKGAEKTKLYVEVHTDPKGMLPDWLINMIQKKWPSKTLSGLANQTAKANPAIPAEYATWHTPAQ